MCEVSSNDSSGGNGRQLQHAFLVPRCPLLSQAHDITFSSIEGDFQVPMRGPSQPLLQPSFESYCQHWGARRHDWLQQAQSEGRNADDEEQDWSAALCEQCPLWSALRHLQAFRGIWRIKEGERGKASSRLSYSLYVRPQVFAPQGMLNHFKLCPEICTRNTTLIQYQAPA